MKACQVVPDIPSFAVDDGFTYLVPEGLDVAVGSRVRVRVSGRRRKGFVTAVFDPPAGRKLIPIDGLSGTVPGFDERHLETLRWAASHYVAPLSTLLKRTMPPNVSRGDPAPGDVAPPQAARFQVVVSDATTHADRLVPIIADAVGRRAGIMVVAPTVVEVARIAATLEEDFGDMVVTATSSSPARDATRSWTRAATDPPVVLVGTREICLWPVRALHAIVVVEDSRRVMKSPATPTIGVREVAVRRARAEGLTVTFLTPMPSPETLALEPVLDRPSGRWWPPVEVADRNEEPPGGGLLLERTRAALLANLREGGSAFVLVPARGYAPAFRCIACGELRRCPGCGAAATRAGECRRCDRQLGPCTACGGDRFQALGAGIGSVRDAIARFAGDAVGVAGEDGPITVGSERDMVDHPAVDLAVAVDLDGASHAPTYRASEDALRLHVRLAHLVGKGRGKRLLVQTARPDQPVVTALLSGNADPFLERLIRERRRAAFPPFGQLIALETTDTPQVRSDVDEIIRPLATVHGPALRHGRVRWLLQGRDLDRARLALRNVVGAWRDRGIRVRVDVDPIDL